MEFVLFAQNDISAVFIPWEKFPVELFFFLGGGWLGVKGEWDLLTSAKLWLVTAIATVVLAIAVFVEWQAQSVGSTTCELRHSTAVSHLYPDQHKEECQS